MCDSEGDMSLKYYTNVSDTTEHLVMLFSLRCGLLVGWS
jgi:hypothetical protein